MTTENEPTPPLTPEERDIRDARTWASLAHLTGLITSFIGPLVIWALYRDRYPFVDDQAREAMNFQISILIYLCAAALLWFLVVPLLAFAIIPILDLVFVVTAAMNASNGVAYRYPLTIRFVQ